MIQGIGIDIIKLARIEKAIRNRGLRFLTRVFTAREVVRCQSRKEKYQYFGGHFAAKEAVMKALGAGRKKGVRWVDIEVIYNQDGKPDVKLYDRAEEVAKSLGISDIHISISHVKEYAIAQAVAIKEQT